MWPGHFPIQREVIKFRSVLCEYLSSCMDFSRCFHRVLKPPPGPFQAQNLLCPFGVAKLVILSPKFLESCCHRKIRWQQSCSTRPGVSTRSRHGCALQRMACHVQQFMHRAIQRGRASVRNLIRKRFFSRDFWRPTGCTRVVYSIYVAATKLDEFGAQGCWFSEGSNGVMVQDWNPLSPPQCPSVRLRSFNWKAIFTLRLQLPTHFRFAKALETSKFSEDFVLISYSRDSLAVPACNYLCSRCRPDDMALEVPSSRWLTLSSCDPMIVVLLHSHSCSILVLDIHFLAGVYCVEVRFYTAASRRPGTFCWSTLSYWSHPFGTGGWKSLPEVGAGEEIHIRNLKIHNMFLHQVKIGQRVGVKLCFFFAFLVGL